MSYDLSNLQSKALFQRMGWAWDEKILSGYFVPVKAKHSAKQRRAFHWLIGQWMELDARIGKDADRLKTEILKSHFGVLRVSHEDGNETFIPLKRTTQEWSWDKAAYVRKELTREQYRELIDYVYRIAAEDGTVLPDLLPEYRRELEAA